MECVICGQKIQIWDDRTVIADNENIRVAHEECPSPWPKIRELETKIKELEVLVRENAGFYVDNSFSHGGVRDSLWRADR
ncbi:hypothetical protein LCGC14_3022750 [marine sediment metagenome]|uniref:Uncharacterized protein n=1 Tax=marine sediment metagenome TaxID=412755 RepID=A0A0F8Z2E0_9ZZZZ